MQIVHQKNEYQRSLLHTTCLFSATERCPSSARLFVSGSFPPRPTDLMPLFLYQLEDVISINHGYSIHGEWFWMERLPSKEATVLSSLMASKNALKQLLGGSCSHGTVRNGSEGGVTLMHCPPMVVRPSTSQGIRNKHPQSPRSIDRMVGCEQISLGTLRS